MKTKMFRCLAQASSQSCFSLATGSSGFFSCAQSTAAGQPGHTFLGASFRFASVLVHTKKATFSLSQLPNSALNPVRFALWTLRDKAAQRRLALRWASRGAS